MGSIRGFSVMSKTGKFLSKLWNDESGVSSVEYALLLAFAAAGIILGAEALADSVEGEMVQAASCIEGTDTC